MYPLLVPGRDRAVIAPLGREPVRGDVVLYRREGGALVLHRVWKVRDGGVYLVGDNQTEIEGPLPLRQMRGRMVAFVRNGRECGVESVPYRVWASCWLRMRPFRHRVAVAAHFLKGKLGGRRTRG